MSEELNADNIFIAEVWVTLEDAKRYGFWELMTDSDKALLQVSPTVAICIKVLMVLNTTEPGTDEKQDA